jgi:hypothetical protein
VDGGIGVLTLPISSSSGVRQRSEAFPPWCCLLSAKVCEQIVFNNSLIAGIH